MLCITDNPVTINRMLGQSYTYLRYQNRVNYETPVVLWKTPHHPLHSYDHVFLHVSPWFVELGGSGSLVARPLTREGI